MAVDIILVNGVDLLLHTRADLPLKDILPLVAILTITIIMVRLISSILPVLLLLGMRGVDLRVVEAHMEVMNMVNHRMVVVVVVVVITEEKRETDQDRQ